MDEPAHIGISYDPAEIAAIFSFNGEGAALSIWERIQQFALGIGEPYVFSPNTIKLSWSSALSLLREFGPLQRSLNFRFKPDESAKEKVAEFARQYRVARESAKHPTPAFSRHDAEEKLKTAGFTRRTLKPFQMDNLLHLTSLENGANFSVPGAGKTTVTMALHILVAKPGQHLLVVCPKAAFGAWSQVIEECFNSDAPASSVEPFVILSGRKDKIRAALASGGRRFVINYDLLIEIPDIISAYLATHSVHLVLDEAHRMKAGYKSQRGAYLLNVASLAARRDILTGTPMPQSPDDLKAQLGFLWPGAGFDVALDQGKSPREVLGNLYVRTTKRQLSLPDPIRRFHHVDMAKGQLALYGLVRSEFLRDFSGASTRRAMDLAKAKRSVMRLLQLSSNPILALRSIAPKLAAAESGIVDQVISEGPSAKMLAVGEMARTLAAEGEKAVIWTIFTDTIHQMEILLADLNPVSLYGEVPSGVESDENTREGRIRKFHIDDSCQVLIANPAAAGEGISLHHVCHNALYLDRSYVTTHYLQSVDRIHRLGLSPDVTTNIHIFQSRVPAGLGSIDYSVSRRLASKLRALQQLLNDEDLHEIAFDEENATDPIDYQTDEQDVIDLIAELEGKISYDESLSE